MYAIITIHVQAYFAILFIMGDVATISLSVESWPSLSVDISISLFPPSYELCMETVKGLNDGADTDKLSSECGSVPTNHFRAHDSM